MNKEMISLKELLKDQYMTGKSDIEIIRNYFVLNGLEEEGIKLAQNLVKDKLQKINEIEYCIDTWLTNIPSKYLYENYSIDVATKLHNLELDYIAHKRIESKSLMEWAKQNIPLIEKPKAYFKPCLDYLRNNGIIFKNDK